MSNNKEYCNITVKLLVIYAIQSLCGGIAFYISLFLKTNTPLSLVQIGTILSATSFGNIIGSFVSGNLADKNQASFGIRLGLIIQGCALFSLVFFENFFAIFSIMLFMGLGSYMYITSSNYILNSKFGSNNVKLSKIIANQNIILNIGMFFSAILMGYCAEGYYVYVFSTLSLVIIAIGAQFKKIDTNFYSTPASVQNKNLNTNYSYIAVGISAIFSLGLVYAQYRTGYPIYLKTNFRNTDIGFIMAINPLMILLFQNLIIRFSARDEKNALLIGMLIFSISFLLLNYQPTLSIILAATGLMTLGEILITTHAQSLIFNHASSQSKGKVLGFFRASYSISKILGSYLAGLLMELYKYQVLWNFCFMIGFGGFILILVLLRQSRKISEAQSI